MIVPQHLQRLRVNLCEVPLQHFCVKRHYNQYILNNNNSHSPSPSRSLVALALSLGLLGLVA